MIRIKKTRLILPLLFAVIGCDQTSKRFLSSSLKITGPMSYWGDRVHFELAQNPGAFLNLGAEYSATVRFWIFNVATLVMMALLAVYLVRAKKMSAVKITALTLILAGGLGNLIDRLFYGSVTDFLILSVGQLRTGIFNVADVAITTGVLILAGT